MNRIWILAVILLISALVLGACRPRRVDQQVQPIKFQYTYSQSAAGPLAPARIFSARSPERQPPASGFHGF